jgi:hypothetical protein
MDDEDELMIGVRTLAVVRDRLDLHREIRPRPVVVTATVTRVGTA